MTELQRKASVWQEGLRGKAPDSSGSGKSDSVEISADAYNKLKTSEMSASSGRDSLSISRGSKEGEFNVNLSDSAAVNRAVRRGYIEVNGERIKLDDGTKREMLSVNKRAQADRASAYKDYVMKHENAVAEQQAEALRQALGGDSFDMLDFILGGKTNSSSGKKNEGVSWNNFEWRSYETQLNVSFNGSEPSITGVKEKEVLLNAGK
jgi:hypothetical protein